MPKIVDHDAMRARLLEGALLSFSDHGFHGLTMRRLAGDLGVTTGTLYHYFPGKEELFTEMINTLGARDAAELASLRPVAGTAADPVAVFLQWLGEKREYFRRIIGLVTDFDRFARSDAARGRDLDEQKQAFRRGLQLYGEAAAGFLGLPADAGHRLVRYGMGCYLRMITLDDPHPFDGLAEYIGFLLETRAGKGDVP